jgi:hypothetical protein
MLRIILILLLGMFFIQPALAGDKLQFGGGVQTGYSYGQNGNGWPEVFNDPWENNARGGFYLHWLRINTRLEFDSTFSGEVLLNISGLLLEAYLQKQWGLYTFKIGKIRGAGLKSGSGTDEFDNLTIYRPVYSRYWQYYKRLDNFRDFGIQIERDYLKGRIQTRFFFHNASGQNIYTNQPSWSVGPPAQAVGFNYALDWKATDVSTAGGHIGVRADHEYTEFLSQDGWWHVNEWFKYNSIIDMSGYHQFDFNRVHTFIEGLLILNRDLRYSDGRGMQTWGYSARINVDHSQRFTSLFRFEFSDNTDGWNPDDQLNLFTLGLIFHPAPGKYRGLKATAEYCYILEEGLKDRIYNDTFFLQLQHSF